MRLECARALSWLALVALSCGVALSSGGVAVASPYDPLLDEPPLPPTSGLKRSGGEARGGGLVVSTDVGLYFGSASSFLSSEEVTLYGGAHPRFGVQFGRRLDTSFPLELSVGGAFGLGETFERDAFDDAFDVFMSARALYTPFQGRSWSLGFELGGQVSIFDFERGTMSQYGVGALLGALLAYRLSDTSALALSFGWNPLYNPNAFYLRDPTEAELMSNPNAYKFKVKGEWENSFQLTVGYRLFNF
jgi:hypothetical protein